MSFFVSWLVTSIAVAFAAAIMPGIQPFGSANSIVCFVCVGLFLGLVNALIKPIVSLLSLPLNIITLGIFSLVINAFMLQLASYLSVNVLGAGVSISSFGTAFLGAIIVSIVTAILGGIL